VEIRESQQRRAGRPERPLDPGNDGPLSAFASSLRELRRAAGNPSYRKLAERALFVPSVLSTAANGCALPSLQVTLAFVGACGGDVVEWRRRWEAVACTLAAPAAGLRGPSPARMASASPAQLPAVCPHFVGRQAECALLLRLTDPDNPSRTGSVTISGPIGVGKSAFALHFAHRATRIYPDGQLYADLAGCRAAGQSPHELLGRFLSALGVPPEQIPDEPQQRAGLYRTVLAGRRVLVMLDDAATESEIRPLLATGTSCLVVTTSRRRLAGLDNARRVTLDVLAADESMALLTGVIGERRIAADADAATMVSELCGHLPIAIWIAATRLLDHHGQTARYAMERLRDPANGLDWLMAGDVSLRHRLRSAYDQLGPSSRRAFRRLGAASGEEIRVLDMASMLDVPPRDAESLLETLVEAGMLQVSARTGGYSMLALFAAAARELLQKREPATAARWLRPGILAAPAA
jgi:hypothetical protein